MAVRRTPGREVRCPPASDTVVPLPTLILSSPAATVPVSRVSGAPVILQAVHRSWLSDGQLGYLKDGDRLLHGRWSRRGEQWNFSFCSRVGQRIESTDTTLEFLDDRWGAKASLVLDTERNWVPKNYRGARRRADRPCAVCSATISEECPEHFYSEPSAVVCARCHLRFVSLRSLAFVPGLNRDAQEPALSSATDGEIIHVGFERAAEPPAEAKEYVLGL